MKILLIDTDLHAQEFLKQLILALNPKYDIVTAYSSFDASQLLRKEKFDVIIIEIYLQGGIQGNELILDVKPKHCFKIGVASVLESPDVRRPFNLFLLKPITKVGIKKALELANYYLKSPFLQE